MVLLLFMNDSVSNHLSQHRPEAHPLGETESQLCNEEFLRRQIKTQNKQQHNIQCRRIILMSEGIFLFF